MRTLLLLATLLAAAAQAPPQTPDQILSELDKLTVQEQALLSQLRALVVPPPIEVPPPVTTAAELTAALAKGGAIQLAPGTYKGNWTVSVPATTITGTSALTGRVAPSDVAGWTLTAADTLRPVVTVLASDVAVRGTTITGVAADRTTVVVGSNTATDVATQPNNVSIDQNAILAIATGGHRGVEAHGSNIRITNNHIASYLEVGRDSQAVWINNGPGPYLVENNYLEASGENFMSGGDSVKIPNMVPSDITIRGNTLFKPQWWRTRPGSVKNLFELKNAQHVLFENNVLDGCWKDGQDGHAIQLTPRNQNNQSPWVIVQDVTLRGNRLANVTTGYAVNITGHDSPNVSQQTRKIVIEGNLFQDAPKGIQVGGGVADYLKVVRNTMPLITGQIMAFYGTGPLTPLTFDLNVARSGAYGVSSPNAAVGNPTLAAWTTGLVWNGNVIERTAERFIPWPSPTSTPSGTTTVLPVGGLAPLLDANFHYPGAGW
jgi:hypothetical protein